MRQLSLPEADWPARSGLVPSLDGIRAISVAIVLVGHMLLPVSLVGVSALGLKIFFFLSGFLITRLLLAESKSSGKISLSDFYIRRLLRLYPVIVVYVTLVVVVTLARGQPFNGIDVVSVFLYFVNYLVIHYDSLGQTMTLPVSMLWSLSVEEHFYLLAPLALVLVRGDARKMLIVAVAIAAISLCLRLIYAHVVPDLVNTLHLYWRSETRFDCIAFGVMLACLTELERGRKLLAWLTTRRAFIGGACLMLASFAIRDHYFQNTWRFTIQGIALFPLVAGVVFGQPFAMVNRVLNTAPFIWVGALSYSLYVWHGGTTFLFGRLIDALPPALLPITELAISFLLAIVSYYAIERPVVGLRKRFMPASRKKISAEPAVASSAAATSPATTA